MAYGKKLAAGVSARVMNYFCFINTKLLFRCAESSSSS